MSEPAIQVRRKGKGTQVWTIETLENKLVDMRDHYRDWKEGSEEVVRNRYPGEIERVASIDSYNFIIVSFCVFLPVLQGKQ